MLYMILIKDERGVWSRRVWCLGSASLIAWSAGRCSVDIKDWKSFTLLDKQTISFVQLSTTILFVRARTLTDEITPTILLHALPLSKQSHLLLTTIACHGRPHSDKPHCQHTPTNCLAQCYRLKYGCKQHQCSEKRPRWP